MGRDSHKCVPLTIPLMTLVPCVPWCPQGRVYTQMSVGWAARKLEGLEEALLTRGWKERKGRKMFRNILGQIETDFRNLQTPKR